MSEDKKEPYIEEPYIVCHCGADCGHAIVYEDFTECYGQVGAYDEVNEGTEEESDWRWLHGCMNPEHREG